MATDAFNAACDRLAVSYDPAGSKERQWEKGEGARLQQAKSVIEKLFEDRDDLSVKLAEKPSVNKNVAVFELSIGATKIVNIAVKINGNSLSVFAVDAEDGVGELSAASIVPSTIDAGQVDEKSIADAIADTLNKLVA